MAGLERRIADLEAVANLPSKLPLVFVIDYVPGLDDQGRQIPRGDVVGIKGLAKRERGESEQAFLERAKTLAIADAEPHATALLLLIER
jgi:hypothetical protein